MAENKKSFVLYADLLKSISHLTDKEKGILFNHLLEYVNDKNPILKDRLILTAWKPIELQLKRDLVKFEQVKVKRSEAGKRSAELRALNKDEQKSTNPTSVDFVQHRSTNPTVTVNDNVNVNDTVINSNNTPTKVDGFNFDVLLEFINSAFERQFRTINKTTKSKYNARLKDGYTKDDIKTAINNCKDIQYHKDNNYQYCTPEFFSRADTLDKYSQKSNAVNTLKPVEVKKSLTAEEYKALFT